MCQTVCFRQLGLHAWSMSSLTHSQCGRPGDRTWVSSLGVWLYARDRMVHGPATLRHLAATDATREISVSVPVLLYLCQCSKCGGTTVLGHHTQLSKPGGSRTNLRDLGMAQEATYSCPLELLCALLTAAVQHIICFLVAPLHCLTA